MPSSYCTPINGIDTTKRPYVCMYVCMYSRHRTRTTPRGWLQHTCSVRFGGILASILADASSITHDWKRARRLTSWTGNQSSRGKMLFWTCMRLATTMEDSGVELSGLQMGANQNYQTPIFLCGKSLLSIQCGPTCAVKKHDLY